MQAVCFQIHSGYTEAVRQWVEGSAFGLGPLIFKDSVGCQVGLSGTQNRMGKEK